MAFITADRVLDSSTSTGTGAIVVSGTPAAGYRTFSAVMSVGDTCYYSIQGQTTSEWEVGLGTYSSANTLTRTTVYSSSNAGSAVTFSAGTKNVFITMVASKSPQLDPTGNVTALGTPASATLTNATGLSLTTGVTGVLPSANGGSLAWQSVQTGNFTAVSGRAYPVNTTSGAVTVTLPASPSAGQIIQVTDYAGTWGTNNVTVAPNGANINGISSNYILKFSRENVGFVYIDATQGWITYSGLNVFAPYSASYLIVGGGGGGGGGLGDSNGAGGGGAGGFLTGTTTFSGGTTYTITVGAGGAGGVNSVSTSSGVQGGNSSITGLTAAIGGGYGGIPGGSGGSGGGSSNGTSGGGSGSGTSGQGNAGGTSAGGPNYGGGGGGGASAVGSNGTSTVGGNGGAGTASSITGSSVTYAGGGGGGTDRGGTVGTGGAGGGGNAGTSNGGNGTAGTANTGGGGGGGSFGVSTAATGGTGGSGVVILSVPSAFYSGITTGSPTVTTSGSNTIIKFTASGSYTA